MLTAPYMSDNPYRLLGVGSAATQSELRQVANAADKAVKVGLSPDSGLMQVFGAEMLSICADKVRSLGANPMERTVYRMFWPFYYQHQSGFDGTQTDLTRLNITGMIHVFYSAQLCFVIRWVSYLVNPSPQEAQQVLAAFAGLYEDQEVYDFLAERLVNDGEEPGEAEDIACGALEVILGLLLTVFSRQAVEWWEAGNTSAAVTLVNTLSESGFDDDIIDKALAVLVAPGERESEKLRDIIENYRGWTPEQPPYETTEVEKLRAVAQALKGRVPAAYLWLEVVDNRISQVALAMREQAIDLANDKDEYEQSGKILAQIQTLPLPVEIEQRIHNDQAQLQKLVRGQEIWNGITPITEGPSLYTINGFGCKIYGRTKFPERPGWYFATYYVVFLFLPIFPMRRYLVSDAPDGGWYFHASAPLTKGGKYHLAISLALTLLFVGYCAFSSTPYSGSSSSSSAYVTPPPSAPAPTNTSASPDVSPPDTDDEKKRLNEEYDHIKSELDTEKGSIDARRTTLESTIDQLQKDDKVLDTTDLAAVDAYNARVKQFRNDKKQFGADVDAYNKNVKRLNDIVQRLHTLGD